MALYDVDCKVEIGCMCRVEAKSEKEAIQIIKEEGWGFGYYETDRAHFDLEAVAMKVRK